MSFKIDVSALSKKELEELKRQLQEKLAQITQKFADSEPRLEQFFDPENYRKNHELWKQNRDKWLSFLNGLGEAIDAKIGRKTEERDEEIKLLIGTSKDWEGKKIADVFIDDIIKYADTQNGTLLDTLKNIFEKAEKEDFSSLPEEQRNAVKKRMEELRQLVVRGRNMINTGTTSVHAEAVLRMTYEMSKEGLREALRFSVGSIENDFPKEALGVNDKAKVDKSSVIKKLGWFQSSNHEKRTIGGKSYGCFTEYIWSKCSSRGYSEKIRMNKDQGYDSYIMPKAIDHKFLVLKGMGYDVNTYQNWTEMKKDVEADGFFANRATSNFVSEFDKYKKRSTLFDDVYKTQVVFDSAIQLVLENTDIPGVDKKTQTMIVIRTENSRTIPSLTGVQKGDNITDNGYRSGICESHGHITASMVYGKGQDSVLTVARVPFSRVHALWFMEAGDDAIDNNHKRQYLPVMDVNKEETCQFWAYHQNEIDVCTKGLPIIYVGKTIQIKDCYKTAFNALIDWEKKNATKTTIAIMNR